MDLREKILELKKERDAVILVHNYQPDEVQDIADFLGDSLELSRIAAKTDAKVIVFCGVHFMAETAKILSPQKTVLLPEPSAGCPMADMITADQLREFKKEYPGSKVVCYVNSSAEVKAESDVCCTSANASEVARSIETDLPLLFVPDQFLAIQTELDTGKNIRPWDGFCHVHVVFRVKDVKRMRELHPRALVVVHPECPPDICELADVVTSTSGMCRFVKGTEAKEIIIGTEIGILHRLRKENPDKKIYPLSENAICTNMKKNDLEKVYTSLRDMKHKIEVPEDIRLKAKEAVDQMVGTLEMVRKG